MQPLVVLRPQIYNILQQQNPMQHPPTVHLWKGSSFEEGEEVYQIFLTSAVIFTRDILSRRKTGNKANPPNLAPKMKRLRQGNGDKLFTKEE